MDLPSILVVPTVGRDMGSPVTILGLARWRQRQDISLEQIAERTKISLQFLRAIEAEEFHKLPGGIFSTSYLRQYASSIDLDPTELLAHYTQSMTPRPKPATREESLDPRSVMDPQRGFVNRRRGLMNRRPGFMRWFSHNPQTQL